jgi:carbonic anhydrase
MSLHTCCNALSIPNSRRNFLKIASLGGGAMLMGLQPQNALAAGHVDALLLSCMDYRLMDEVGAYMNKRGLKDNYDHVVLAGSSLGAVTSKYPGWGQTFNDHLGLAIKLHDIQRVIVIDHRDCGAYRLVLGKDLKDDAEKAAHAKELHTLAKRIHAKHPKLPVETFLMNLDGSVEAV